MVFTLVRAAAFRLAVGEACMFRHFFDMKAVGTIQSQLFMMPHKYKCKTPNL